MSEPNARSSEGQPPEVTTDHQADGLGRIVAVVVTYNRPELLRRCLDGLAAQDRPIDAVVVIDNASTDDSGDVARQHPIAADVLTMERNHGGAGGFATGMARAMSHHRPDWLWLMDDDTVATPGAVAGLEEVARASGERVDVLSSTAIWTDGRVHPMNVSRRRVRPSGASVRLADEHGARPIRTASFVAFAVRARAVASHGLPWADYFIWGDDTEYSARVLRDGTGLQIPQSVVEHHTRRFGSWQSDPGERFYFDVRNKLWLFWRSGSFRWWENALYGGSAAVGWARTIGRSQARGTLIRRAIRGFIDALTTAPRPTDEVLVTESQVIDDVRQWVNPPTTRISGMTGKRLAPAERVDGETLSFSVVIPVYLGSELDSLVQAVDSVTVGQTCPPDEIVIVLDGPVQPQVRAYIDGLRSQADRAPAQVAGPQASWRFAIVCLDENQGLSEALNAGVRAAAHPVIARMDADDFSEPDRFAAQRELLASGHHLIGSAVQEWDGGPTAAGPVRSRPLTAAAIEDYAAFHNPFHHPTVMFRREAVEAVGGYQQVALMEDYWLFARLIAAGASVANLAEPLVRYRVDRALYERRGGLSMFRSDMDFQLRLHHLGLTNRWQLTRNLVQRFAYRVVPSRVRQFAYAHLVNRT